MAKRHPAFNSQRVGLLVDCENLYHSSVEVEGKTVDYWKLLDTLVNGRHLVRAMAFIRRRKGDDDFINALEEMGYIIHTPSKDNGDIDVQMAVKAISIVPRVDVEILVTGDADFVPVCEYLRNHGIRVEVAQYQKWMSNSLTKIADRYTPLQEKEVTIHGRR